MRESENNWKAEPSSGMQWRMSLISPFFIPLTKVVVFALKVCKGLLNTVHHRSIGESSYLTRWTGNVALLGGEVFTTVDMMQIISEMSWESALTCRTGQQKGVT